MELVGLGNTRIPTPIIPKKISSGVVCVYAGRGGGAPTTFCENAIIA
jgi:hypothetical protein